MPSTNDNQTLDRIAERAGRLYTLPAVAVEVLQLTSCDQVDVAALKACIENDPALATKILRVVNSSIFGLSCRVTDLGQALSLLGTKPLKMLVLGFSLPAGMSSRRRRRDATRHLLTRYWRTTLIKAVAARKLATTVFRQEDGDEAFLVSLLQDLGMMVLVEQLGEKYADFVVKVWRAHGDLAALERESLGFEHRQLGVRLLQQWGLPEGIFQPIAAAAEDSSAGSANTALRIANLAERLAELLVEGRPERLEELYQAEGRIDELQSDRLRAFVTDLQQQVADLSQALGLDTQQEPDYAEIVTQAHEQLSALASESVVDMLDARPAECIAPELLAQVRELSQAASLESRPQDKANLPAGDLIDTSADDRWFDSVDPGIVGRVQNAAAQCRQSRRPLSLLLVEVVEAMEPVLAGVAEDAPSQLAALRYACTSLGPGNTHLMAAQDSGFAIVLPDCDRRHAKEVFELVARQFRANASNDAALCGGAATVGLVPKNFAAADLTEPAARCLRAARHSGGNCLKTIEVC